MHGRTLKPVKDRMLDPSYENTSIHDLSLATQQIQLDNTIDSVFGSVRRPGKKANGVLDSSMNNSQDVTSKFSQQSRCSRMGPFEEYGGQKKKSKQKALRDEELASRPTKDQFNSVNHPVQS